ncbi:putative integral membrane protein involved in polysaccharide production [Desulfosarcina variabilis str. Montpellier]
MSEKETEIEKAIEVSRKRITINAAASYISLLVELAAGLFLQAFIVRVLGRSQYSLWPITSACIGFVSLIPVGVGYGAGRFIAHSLSKGRLDEVQQISSSLFWGMCVTAIFYFAVAAGISFYFETLFTIPVGSEGVGPWIMLYLGMAGALAMPISVFRGGLVATQQYVAINTIGIFVCLLRVGLTVALFTIGLKNLVWVAAVSLMVSVMEGVAIWRVCRRLVPWQQIRFSAFRWKILRETTSYSSLVLLLRLFNLLYYQTDYILINKMMEPTLVTGYAIVASFVLKIESVLNRGCGVIMPAVATLQAHCNYDRIARLVERTNRIIVPVAVPAYLFLILFGEEVLSLYVGEEYMEYAGLFYIIAAYEILWSTQKASRQVLHGLGKLGLYVPVHLFFAALNLVLSLFFVRVAGWGLYGLAAGTAISQVLLGPVFLNIYIGYLLKQPIGRQLFRHVAVPLMHCLPVSGVMMLLYHTVACSSLCSLLSVLCISLFIHLVWLLMFGLPFQERRTLQRFCRVFLLNRAGRARGNLPF